MPSLAVILKVAAALKISGTDLMAATERNIGAGPDS